MATDLIVPKLGESISEAIVSKWLKQIGEPIAVDEPVVDLETDKVSVALPSPVAGVMAEQRFAAGATVKVGDVIGRIEPGPETPIGKHPSAPEKVPLPAMGATATGATAATGATGTGAAATGATERATGAAPTTMGPTAATAAPTGATAAPTGAAAAPTIPHSKTLPPSVRKAIREGAVAEGNGAAARGAPPTAPRPAAGTDREEVVALSPLRKRIAERLVEAQHSAAILTTFNELDMSAILALRSRFGEAFTQRHGIKLGFMSFFVKACVEGLRQWPGLNAELRGTDVIYKKHYDFGIAVGSGRGLVVPVLRNVDQLGFAEVEKGIAALAQKAKDNRLTLDELQGGTFSITNGGIYGSLMSTPLLNMPQTGILGMHNIVKRPVAVGDQIELRPMMYLALSYDHRVVDGREAVSFLVGIKERLEAPERMLLAV